MTSDDQRKVIIHDYIFDYERKAPFVNSGVSVYGAIEWDEKGDKIRCHECGVFRKDLASHITQDHQLDSHEYRERHGLRLNTALWAFSLRRNAKRIGSKGVQFKPGNSCGKSPGRPRGQSSGAETANLTGRCCAQELFKIQTLAESIGRTPTVKELEANGIFTHRLRTRFNASMEQIMLMAGLRPNRPGVNVSNRQAKEDAE